MLAKLLKDYEILFNKVRFIQAVIAGSIKINKVKRQQIMLKCQEIGLKTMVELNAILDPFIKDKRKQARIVSVQEQAGSGDENQIEEVKENEIPTSHYDYLLSMPLWSLTEERVIDLEKQMHRKKDEHDTLQKRSIFQIWDDDLKNFLECLDKIEEKEEQDRLAQGGVKSEGKRKKKAPVLKKGEPLSVPKPKVQKPKEQPDDYIPLAQRLAMRPDAVVQSITQGKPEKTARAILGGIGKKRDLEEADLLKNREIEGPPTDAMQKRVRAPNSNTKPKPQAAGKRVRRAIVEESSEEEIELESDWSASESESAFNENDAL